LGGAKELLMRHLLVVMMGWLVCLPMLASAITLTGPVVVDAGAGLSDTQPAVAVDPSGSNAGRLHVVYLSIRPDASIGVAYRRESAPGSNVFGAPVLINASGAPGVITAPAIAVDAAGDAHVVWVRTANNIQHLWYSRVSGTTASNPVQITPSANRLANWPRIAALRFASGGPTRLVVAYVGNDLLVTPSDTEVQVISSVVGGAWGSPVNLTRDTASGEQNLDMSLVESIASGGAIVPQGAIVYEQAGSIFGLFVESATSTAINFGTPRLIASGGASAPTVATQSVAGSVPFMVAHVAYRRSEGGSTLVGYTQAALLPTGSYTTARVDTLPLSNFPAWPSILVEPATTVAERFDKPVTVSWFDRTTRSLTAARNTGGLSADFGLTGTTRPPSPFFDTGTLPVSSGFATDSPRVMARTVIGGVPRVRLAATEDNRLVLFGESAFPQPTPSPTPSPSPSPSASPTASVSPSATPTTGPSPTPSPSATPSASPSPLTTLPPPTVSPSFSATPSPSISPTISSTPSVSVTPSRTPTPSPSRTPTATPSPCVVTRAVMVRVLLARPFLCPGAQLDLNGDGVVDIADLVVAGN
jgi:hypothetical protein